jgi:hypothetical protein
MLANHRRLTVHLLSEVISSLQALLKMEGDIPVVIEDEDGALCGIDVAFNEDDDAVHPHIVLSYEPSEVLDDTIQKEDSDEEDEDEE